MSQLRWDTVRRGSWGRTWSWTASATETGASSRRRVTRDAFAESSTPQRSMTSVGAEANIHEGVAVVDDLAGSSPGDPQAGREQAGGVEPALLKPGHG